jgi:hypothetical protein
MITKKVDSLKMVDKKLNLENLVVVIGYYSLLKELVQK